MGYSDAHLCINLQGKPLLPISQVWTVRLSTSFFAVEQPPPSENRRGGPIFCPVDSLNRFGCPQHRRTASTLSTGQKTEKGLQVAAPFPEVVFPNERYHAAARRPQ